MRPPRIVGPPSVRVPPPPRSERSQAPSRVLVGAVAAAAAAAAGAAGALRVLRLFFFFFFFVRRGAASKSRTERPCRARHMPNRVGCVLMYCLAVGVCEIEGSSWWGARHAIDDWIWAARARARAPALELPLGEWSAVVCCPFCDVTRAA